MATPFRDAKCVILLDFLHQGSIKLRSAIQQKRPELFSECVVLLDDNAKLHKIRFVASDKDHLAYSHNLAPSDLFLH